MLYLLGAQPRGPCAGDRASCRCRCAGAGETMRHAHGHGGGAAAREDISLSRGGPTPPAAILLMERDPSSRVD
eukprot:485925-Prymnesium_polylepis.1